MLTVEYARNPVWYSETGREIFLFVKFEEFAEELPFTAASYDSMPHGVDIYNRAKSGEFGEIAPFISPENYVQPTVEGAQTL
jgi:hypothetical protein